MKNLGGGTDITRRNYVTGTIRLALLLWCRV